MTIHHVITINIGEGEATRKLLELLTQLLDDPKGQKKQRIMDKLDAILTDLKSTVQ